MHGTDIPPLGEIQIQGTVHGVALNALVYLYSDPSDWQFQQFASQAQLEQFAREHHLVVLTKKE
jgi:hypothetical protein